MNEVNHIHKLKYCMVLLILVRQSTNNGHEKSIGRNGQRDASPAIKKWLRETREKDEEEEKGK